MTVKACLDLGTGNSCIAYYNKSTCQVEIIPNSFGKRTTPSIVYINSDKKVLVGDLAKKQMLKHPLDTIYQVKRFMGKKTCDIKVPFNFKDGKIIFSHGLELYPEEISSYIIEEIVNGAKNVLKDDIELIITVPAYFNENQRKLTMKAAELANVKVLRIINEPTAAAIAYIKQDTKEKQRILVIDIGSGTFDCSIVESEDDLLQVKSTHGNNNLGGEDIDSLLVNFLIEKFNLENLSKKEFSFIKKNCEELKKEFSNENIDESTVEISIEEEYCMKREEFNDILKPFYSQIIGPIQECLFTCFLSKEDIDEIVMVGGTSRLLFLQKIISEFFNGKKVNKKINPDEAIAYGGAIQAELLSEDTKEEMVIIDTVSLSIGVETSDFLVVPIIENGSQLPIKMSKIFTTNNDNQEKIKINVFEGNRALSNDNHFIGSFELSIEPKPRGVPKIRITFELDTNSLLKVHVEEEETDNKAIFTVSKELFAEETDLLRYTERLNDDEIREKLRLKNNVENFLFEIKKRNLNPEQKKIIENEFDEIKNGKVKTAEEYQEKIDQLNLIFSSCSK